MFLFGHIGIGTTLARPFIRSQLDLRAVVWGTVIPDLIDKPLYYGFSYATGLKGSDLGWLCGTRTFGHTGLFLIALVIAARVSRSRVVSGLVVGVLTHVLLDKLLELLPPGSAIATINDTHGAETFMQWISALFDYRGVYGSIPFAWPLLGFKFAAFPFSDWVQHLKTFFLSKIFWSEILGIALLVFNRRPGGALSFDPSEAPRHTM